MSTLVNLVLAAVLQLLGSELQQQITAAPQTPQTAVTRTFKETPTTDSLQQKSCYHIIKNEELVNE